MASLIEIEPMPAGIQRDLLAIGREGCYMLCGLHVVELETGTAIQPHLSYCSLLSRLIIGPDCYVNNMAALLELYTNRKWRVLRASTDGTELLLDYKLRPGEHDIGRWERKLSPTETMTHFTYLGPEAAWDPYGSSQTVRLGYLVSRRILRKV